MRRPQLTLALFLALVAWVLSAMPAPTARADARNVITARACGWLDVEERALNGGDRADQPIPTPEASGVNTLRFRLVPAETLQSASRCEAAPPLATSPPARPPHTTLPLAPAPRPTSEALLSLREPHPAGGDPDAPIVWLVPMPSRWAQRRTVEVAQQLAWRASWSWGLPTTPSAHRAASAPTAPAGIGSLSARAASPWLGDRCRVLMRVQPAHSASVTVDRPARRAAAATLAAAMSGLAALLQEWSARIEQVAQQQATASRPTASHEGFEWSQSASGLMILGL